MSIGEIYTLEIIFNFWCHNDFVVVKYVYLLDIPTKTFTGGIVGYLALLNEFSTGQKTVYRHIN